MLNSGATFAAVVAVLLTTFVLVLVLITRRSSPGPLPPGPKRHWIVGNLADMALTPGMYKTYAGWKSVFGDIISLSSFGNVIIILNSYEALVEVFVKNGQHTSGRITTPIMEVTHQNESIVLGHFDNPRWKVLRRMGERFFALSSIRRHLPQIVNEARDLVLRIMKEDSQIFEEIHLTQGRLTMSLVFGFDLESIHDPIVSRIEEITLKLFDASLPGLSIYNFIPLLRQIPEWLPGGSWRRKALALRDEYRDVYGAPSRRSRANEKRRASFLSDLEEDPEVDDTFIFQATADLYAPSVETPSAFLMYFFQMILSHPSVEKKAQEEIDRVVGQDRLPSEDDQQNLVYLDALLKEVGRFCVPVPLAVPHCMDDNAIIKGYLFPKGATVLPNMWAISRDTAIFGEDADEFRPERFLVPQPPMDPRPLVFGIGRRRCLGQSYAELNIFLIASAFLATMKMRWPIDRKTGKEYLPQPAKTGVVVELIHDLPCRVEPRRPNSVALLTERVPM